MSARELRAELAYRLTRWAVAAVLVWLVLVVLAAGQS